MAANWCRWQAAGETVEGDAELLCGHIKSQKRWRGNRVDLNISSDLAGLASVDASELEMSRFTPRSIDAHFVENHAPELADRVGLLHWYFRHQPQGRLELALCLVDTLTSDLLLAKLQSAGIDAKPVGIVAADTGALVHDLRAPPGAVPAVVSHWWIAAGTILVGLCLVALGYRATPVEAPTVEQLVPKELSRIQRLPRLDEAWLEDLSVALELSPRARVMRAGSEADGATRFELIVEGDTSQLTSYFSRKGWMLHVQRSREGHSALTLRRQLY